MLGFLQMRAQVDRTLDGGNEVPTACTYTGYTLFCSPLVKPIPNTQYEALLLEKPKAYTYPGEYKVFRFPIRKHSSTQKSVMPPGF